MVCRSRWQEALAAADGVPVVASHARAVAMRDADVRRAFGCRSLGVAGRRRAALAPRTHAATMDPSYETVGDVMTTGTLYSCKPWTTVVEALEMIVEYRITGLPVVNEKNEVIGVVSDFDLLALDVQSLRSLEIFPSLDQSWKTFLEVRELVGKVSGKIVEDVMSYDPLVVRPSTSLDSAARLLLESKIRRLPVVDKDGKLIGMLSRRNIVIAALELRKANDDNMDSVSDTV